MLFFQIFQLRHWASYFAFYTNGLYDIIFVRKYSWCLGAQVFISLYFFFLHKVRNAVEFASKGQLKLVVICYLICDFVILSFFEFWKSNNLIHKKITI
jgi:hypothetical protein